MGSNQEGYHTVDINVVQYAHVASTPVEKMCQELE